MYTALPLSLLKRICARKETAGQRKYSTNFALNNKTVLKMHSTFKRESRIPLEQTIFKEVFVYLIKLKTTTEHMVKEQQKM